MGRRASGRYGCNSGIRWARRTPAVILLHRGCYQVCAILIARSSFQSRLGSNQDCADRELPPRMSCCCRRNGPAPATEWARLRKLADGHGIGRRPLASSTVNRASASAISSRIPASARGSFAKRSIVRIRMMRCRSRVCWSSTLVSMSLRQCRAVASPASDILPGAGSQFHDNEAPR
jgi:hypothetical protein